MDHAVVRGSFLLQQAVLSIGRWQQQVSSYHLDSQGTCETEPKTPQSCSPWLPDLRDYITPSHERICVYSTGEVQREQGIIFRSLWGGPGKHMHALQIHTHHTHTHASQIYMYALHTNSSYAYQGFQNPWLGPVWTQPHSPFYRQKLEWNPHKQIKYRGD